ncbi:MAG: PUA domain-containing protein, partial [Candidatus Hydrothermarchaeaceae archaeon]
EEFGRCLVEVSFTPETNSIFSVGVEAADERIRPGDEVIVVRDSEVAGVGRAALNGAEMVRVKKGLAVALRHRR